MNTLHNLFGFMSELADAPCSLLGNSSIAASYGSLTVWRSPGLEVVRRVDSERNTFFDWTSAGMSPRHPAQGVAFMHTGRPDVQEIVFSTICHGTKDSYHLSQAMVDDQTRNLRSGTRRHGWFDQPVTWESVPGSTRSLLQPGDPSPEDVNHAIDRLPSRLREKFDSYIRSQKPASSLSVLIASLPQATPQAA